MDSGCLLQYRNPKAMPNCNEVGFPLQLLGRFPRTIVRRVGQ